ncbi:MAG: IS1595 family transposase [Gemmatimonadales bacterium]
MIRQLPVACGDERLAVEFMERQRWGDSPACPRCGDLAVRQMLAKDGSRSKRFLWKCSGCKQQFTVRVGTIMEDSPIPLRHWCYAFWAACASKKGVSALQIQRQTGLSYKSALFLMHRIRFAMTPDGPAQKLTGIVEADETYVGGRTPNRSRAERLALRAQGHKRMPMQHNDKVPVVALVQRGGDVRAMVLPTVNASNVQAVLLAHIDPSARLMTDDSNIYNKVGKPFASHESVKHSLYEYVRGEAHINGAESFFSRLKRQLYGTHQAVSPKHLHRYVAEVAFKHNTRKMEDGERTVAAIQGADGKRLRYRQPTNPRKTASN